MESLNEKKFSLSIDNDEKIFNAEAQGSFNPNDANAFVEEYTQIVSKINPLEYSFIFNGADLMVSSKDMVPMLTACLEMYKKDNFKKILFKCGSNVVLKMQIHRLSKSVELQNCEII